MNAFRINKIYIKINNYTDCKCLKILHDANVVPMHLFLTQYLRINLVCITFPIHQLFGCKYYRFINCNEMYSSYI